VIIEKEFYLREDVVCIAKELLGKIIFTCFEGITTGGIITETEAYAGVTDKASHAYGGRRTARTEIMYRDGGTAYVYLCYGVHSLFNVVTNISGIPHAILIRAIKPETGIEHMLKRTRKASLNRLSGNGPGKVSSLLGIHYSHSGMLLTGNEIWLEDRDHKKTCDIIITKRVGIDYAKEDALLPYRFIYPLL
jgi:DNA-3-methyladenine glycosylase